MRLLTFSLFATLLSAPAFAADLGTYRPGTPYSSAVAAGADVCDNQCAGDAQCRGWNYVKPNPRAAGICEFLSSVSAPIASQISISGESASANALSSRVTQGQTNTIRVGTQPASRPNTVRVGQSPSGRRIVRQAVPQRIHPKATASVPAENMSLTEQQNRYRQGQPQPQHQAPVKVAAPTYRPTYRQPAQAPRQMFRPLLDAPSAAMQAQPPVQRMQRPVQRPVDRQASRRVTGPRRTVAPQANVAPQYQNPRVQMPQDQFPQAQPQISQPQPQMRQPQQVMPRGSARPPVGQPIPAAQTQTRQQPRPQRSTPSQRLAQFKAQTQPQAQTVPPTGSIALNPDQAHKSLFGRLNDDVKSAPAMPTASSVPTKPVTEQPLEDVLAGGL